MSTRLACRSSLSAAAAGQTSQQSSAAISSEKDRIVPIVPPSFLPGRRQALEAAPSREQADQEKNQEHREEDLGDASGRRRQGAEAEHAGDQRDGQEYQGPI